MKRLTLVRHAKSSWDDPDLGDFDRPLNKRGTRDAADMGERLAARGNPPERIVTSPARRAWSTAKKLAKRLGYAKEKIVTEIAIYEASPETLLALVQKLNDRDRHVLLVGHNPGLTDLANRLCDFGVSNMPTGATLCLDFEVDTWAAVWAGAGRVVFYDYPKKQF